MFVRKDSSIKTVADIKGKRYPSGWSQFPNSIPLSLGIMATEGLTFKDIKGVPVTNIIRGADDFKAGKLDFGIYSFCLDRMFGSPRITMKVKKLLILDILQYPTTIRRELLINEMLLAYLKFAVLCTTTI